MSRSGWKVTEVEKDDSPPPIIVATGLTKRYERTLALDHLDLTVHQGEVYGFLGPNGSGKTTTIRLLLGLHRPTEGSSTVFGLDGWGHAVAIHRRAAYVAGEPTLWPSLTGEETLEFLANVHGSVDRDERARLIERFQLEPDKKVRAYSKGNRQKLQIIAAFATLADLLVLDEPTSGLDPLMEVAFRQTVTEAKARGQTIFLSSHILSEVEALCDRVGILRAGRLVEEGTLARLRHLAVRSIDVTFGGPVPALPRIPGVTETSVGEQVVRYHLEGPVGPLIDALAGTSVAAITSREPSLEEVFLAHYGGDGGEPPSR